MKKIPASFPKTCPKSFPFRAGRGNATATLYRTVTKGNDEFKIPIRDPETGQRKFHCSPDYESAREKGNNLLDQLIRGDLDSVTLRASDKVIYCRAVDALKPTGVALDRAAVEFAGYWKQMGGDHFKEAVTEFLKRQGTLKAITVPELVDLFIEQKTRSTIGRRVPTT